MFFFSDDGRNRPEPRPGSKNAAKNPLPKPEQYQCLVRARLRQKKISTVVSLPDRPRGGAAVAPIGNAVVSSPP